MPIYGETESKRWYLKGRIKFERVWKEDAAEKGSNFEVVP